MKSPLNVPGGQARLASAMGGPLWVEVNGCELVLRRTVTEQILVETKCELGE